MMQKEKIAIEKLFAKRDAIAALLMNIQTKWMRMSPYGPGTDFTYKYWETPAFNASGDLEVICKCSKKIISINRTLKSKYNCGPYA